MKTLLLALMVAVPPIVAFCVSAGNSSQESPTSRSPAPKDYLLDDSLSVPPEAAEVILGDRLFFETRFSQFFFAHCNGDVNARLPEGDPLMNEVPVTGGLSLPGPFRGQGINCRHCHLGDDFLPDRPLAQRTYCDFSRRSPIPRRSDGQTHTMRNTPLTINLGLPREVPILFHFDGEFANAEDLVVDTLTGRNLGWLPQETSIAVAHIAKVIREDAGVNPRNVRNYRGNGVPYRNVMLGLDPAVPRYLQLPLEYRVDVITASDERVMQAIAKLMHAYMNSLRFGTRNTRRESGSPYDLFLEKNHLPTAPENEESDLAYAQRVLSLIDQSESFEWVTSKDGSFRLHNQPYQFGAHELQGLKIFFARTDVRGKTGKGNCVMCHTPPQFTDHSFHNNGGSQKDYEDIFGRGAFTVLEVPDLTVRNAQFNTYMPASSKHPHASGRFRSAPSADKPGYADLGVWNIFANPDFPKPQAALVSIFCRSNGKTSSSCKPERILPQTIACFKTPSVRDLGHSYPYFHSGRVDSIEEVLHYYIVTSELARAGKIRNASAELLDIRINSSDLAPLAAFLRSLNEDYH